jgi:hypothetical protein
MRRIFWGFWRNWFLIDPLHYLSSSSDFGFEFAEIFLIEKSRRVGESLTLRGVTNSPTRQVGESQWWVPSNLLLSSHFWTKTFFFRKTVLTSPHNFFWYWNLYRWGLGIGRGHFGLDQCLGLEISFFRRVTKIDDRHLISSPPIVT